MGWANCGEDSKGRPIGYAHNGTCDHPGCTTAIHRGLAYACGGMHGTCADMACEGYFCDEHRVILDPKPGSFLESELGPAPWVCLACEAALRELGELADEEVEA